jgi:predicted anti-sigma-YlaC factor YlaD
VKEVMSKVCERSFDEVLLSGYLDDALTQAEAQRIRIHLEDCGVCRGLYDELSTLREAARTTAFQEPDDAAWPELPKTRVSRFSRSLGWLVVVSWLIVVSVLALWRFLSQAGDPLEVFIVLGLPGGFVLLFASVLLDRLRELKTDRYRGVFR